MGLTVKQREYYEKADKRWGVKTGATGAGKTYVDTCLTIPGRVLLRKGKPGLNVIIGNTRSTVQRNIIEPMQELYGTRRVSSIRSDNMAYILGEKVYCLGADNKRQVDRLRGSTIKYAYGDEVTTWSPEVFDILKSRLRLPYSQFDGTCNPTGPSHWFKKFLDSDADIYQQSYTIEDNPYLPAEFVEQLKKEYAGTVYYDRYIRGLWVAAEGLIYRRFADNPGAFIVDEVPPLIEAIIGVDFGGGKSGHAFCCVGFTPGYREMVILRDEWIQEALDPATLTAEFLAFAAGCDRFPVHDAWCDNEETTLINGLSRAVSERGWPLHVGKCLKRPINDRIRTVTALMGAGRFRIMRNCTYTIEALQAAQWSDKATEDVRLDDGTTNIDSLDCMEYGFERRMAELGMRW